ncbi:MAG: hypothetical protein SGPRY_006136 [Prymnesium sp.]
MGYMPPAKFTKHAVADAEPGKGWNSKSDQDFVGLCEDERKFDVRLMTTFVGKKLCQTAPLAKGVSVQVPQLAALDELADELKPGMLVAVNVPYDERGHEGAYWLAKLLTSAYELTEAVL